VVYYPARESGHQRDRIIYLMKHVDSQQSKFRHKLALIVPTMHRFELLTKLLNSIRTQSAKPEQIIIVDGSTKPLEADLRDTISIAFDYLHIVPPSLTKQRNAGLKTLRPEITLVGYLDDDIEILPGSIERMMDFFENATDHVAGASFNIVNGEMLKSSLPFRIFGIRSTHQGVVLKSGFNTYVYPKKEITEVQWLCGGATLWRRDVFEKFKYDEWYKGSSYFEDFDFSYQISRTEKLFVIREAKVEHNPPPFIPKKGTRLGEMYMTYRYYFVKKHFGHVPFLYFWSSLGMIVLNLFSWIKRRQPLYFYMALGNIIGAFKIVLGKIEGINDQFRVSLEKQATAPEKKEGTE
jgi:GT2 family glycosyltransferase